ncbi:kinase-like domain-containing protein [Phellopilus nigrolimitatus]|nr:kinase-like domain-containing protein [Phellopilus nigrolimitatus]
MKLPPRQRLCREVLLWRQLRHPHLLELFGILHTKEKVLFPTMVAPWMEHGTVLQYVRNYPQVSKLTLLSQVARALNYLHRHDPPIVHQDIRCANILVNGFCEAVLSDFGLSRNIMSSLQDGCTHATDSKSRHASRKTDIWSFGMVILELFTEAVPFSHIAHDAAVVIDLYHGALPRRPEPHEIRGLNSEIADFDVIWNIIEQCWTKAPRERPSASLLVREIGKEVEARKREEEKIRMGTTITDSGYQG